MPDCRHHCDHCAPDAWHDCIRPRGHSGYHSCQPDPDDVEDTDA